MSAGGVFGALAFVGMSILIYRRLFDARIRATSKVADIMILLVLYALLIFKLHLVFGMSLFLLFPFTRLVHVFNGFAAPIKYLWRTGYQIVRKRG